MRMFRVCRVISTLLGTNASFEEACKFLGYDPLSFTLRELRFIIRSIFQCDDCGLWCETYRKRQFEDGYAICDDCLYLEFFDQD